ncbi:MAG TPA: SPFH domain-containing protein [Candidatus Absconditabacterales bacterium]|nr:SPFH domain-containing protein [Candidatus Absconditabacterales bacterium]
MYTTYIIVGSVVLFLLILSIRIVKPNTVAVVLFLGKTGRILREGINFIVPLFESIRRQSLALINLSVKVDGITKDNVKTLVNINVIYRVKSDDTSIIDSLFKNSNVVQTITSLIEEQLRARIFEFSHEEIFAKRSEIGDEIKETLRIKMSEFGMELDSVQVVDIQLDQKVVEAMNNVVASQKNKKATITEAEGSKQSQILSAEGDKEVKKLLGEGMALQREAIAKGFKNSIGEIKETDASLSGKDILDFLLNSSRIETLEKLGVNNAKIIYINENLEGKSASMINQK